jgi:dTDP-3-amino-3,6-dideoxy-alpha-D-glucopyranose N,N-dimethyltransferase/dTDP-3-amino-3,4,6-trideoxy-alpha-D-glucopyranose N,N-dimethyltransferase/N-methyltransferase
VAATPFSLSAPVYDLLYEASGKDYAAEAAALHDLIQRRRPGAASLLDVACGTGAHLAHLRRWYDVAGVDVEPAMIGQAQGRLPEADLRVGDMRSLRLGRRFDAVICLFSSIGYMRSPDELALAVAAMAGHLAPGGVLVVDGWLRPAAWRDPGVVHALAAGGGDLAAARVGVSRRDGRRTHLAMHHLVGTPDGVEHVVEHHELTLFDDAEYREAFRRADLAVEVVDSPLVDRDRYVATRAQ